MQRIKLKFISIIFLGLTSSFTFAADKDANVCVYGNETVDSVVCYKPTVLKQMVVKGDVKVVGTLRAENVTLQNLNVEGNAELTNVVVSQTTKIAGSLKATNVQFKQGISVNSDSISLINSTVNGMVTVTSPVNTPYLQVLCGSVIEGAVLFDGRAGVIQVSSNNYLIKGNISQGTKTLIDFECPTQ